MEHEQLRQPQLSALNPDDFLCNNLQGLVIAFQEQTCSLIQDHPSIENLYETPRQKDEEEVSRLVQVHHGM